MKPGKMLEAFFENSVGKLLASPDPSSNESDDPWSESHLLDNEWVKIEERRNWFESPEVPRIYKDHKYIFNGNMGMGKPHERMYRQNMDDNNFETEFVITEELPSGIGGGEMRLTSEIGTKYAPSGENDFCLVEYIVSTELKYDMPPGITWLPRIIANPLNRFFVFAFMFIIASDMVERDAEYARERTAEYHQYLRQYHGEEPTQTRTRRAEFHPQPEDGVFFE